MGKLQAKIALEDGTVLNGFSFRATGECYGEAVFNTSMTGYQEIRTHPSYKGQIVTMPTKLLTRAKAFGFSDIQLARLLGSDQVSIFKLRHERGVIPAYKLVDTCAAEFEAFTPYFYSTYETEDEIHDRRT